MTKKDISHKKEVLQKKIKRAKALKRELLDKFKQVNELMAAEQRSKDEKEIEKIKKELLLKK